MRDALPIVKPRLDLIKTVNTFTWLGQSTCLFSLEGLRILTDPVFDHEKRLRPSPCQVNDIKSIIDIVLVSHQHFDHLGEKKKKKKGRNRTEIHIL